MSADTTEEIAAAWMRTASAAEDEDKRTEAYSAYQSALALWRSCGDRAQQAACLLRLAFLAGWVPMPPGTNAFALASSWRDEALAIYREVGDEAGVMKAARAVAATRAPAGRDALLAEALEIAERLGEPLELGRTHAAAARTLARQDRPRSLRHSDRAVDLFRRIDAKGDLAIALFSRSLARQVAGSDGSREDALESLRLSRELGRHRDIAQTVMMLGNREAEGNDIAENIALYREGMEAARLAGSPGWAASCARAAAELLRRQGNDDEAASMDAAAERLDPKQPDDEEFAAAFAAAISENDPTKSAHKVGEVFAARSLRIMQAAQANAAPVSRQDGEGAV